MDYALSCRLLENFQVQVSSRSHSWIVDEPVELDGDDLGPNPFELLLGAVGSCTVVTVAHYAAQGGVPLEGLWVDVDGTWDDAKQFHIAVTMRVRGDLSEKDLGRLMAYTRKCAVHKLLEPGVDIATEIVRV